MMTITDPCPFAAHEAHAGPCFEMMDYTERVKAHIYAKSCQECGADAVWEVPFANAPHYEYFCAAHMPAVLRGERLDASLVLA